MKRLTVRLDDDVYEGLVSMGGSINGNINEILSANFGDSRLEKKIDRVLVGLGKVLEAVGNTTKSVTGMEAFISKVRDKDIQWDAEDIEALREEAQGIADEYDCKVDFDGGQFYIESKGSRVILANWK